MSYEKGNAKGNANSMMSVASVPVALTGLLLLFFFATTFADDVMIDTGKLVILPLAAASAAVLGRIGILNNSSMASLLSLGFILVAIILEIFSIADPILSLTVVTTGIFTLYLTKSERNEEATVVFSIIAGFHLAVSYASGMPELTIAEGSSVQGQFIDIERASIAANFFSFWIASITLGVIMAIFMRGMVDQPGKGNLFSFLPESFNPSENREPLVVALIIFIVNLIPLMWISSITDVVQFESHLYLGNVWSIFTTIVVMFVAFCRAERWHVIGGLVSVNWVIYTLAHLVEIGNSLPTSIDFLSSDDTISTLTWFGIWFWTNVLTAMFASRGYFGDISPRREPSSFRKWWQTNYYSILLASAVIVGFLIRTGWNVLPAMNANITGIWDMSGGSDPWYMKRVVDYIIMERSHFIFDADRAYPVGGINPRPPLFSWYLALGGLALEWITGIPSEDVVWWSVAGLPAVFGALIILPVSGIARRVHSSQAGIIAAWLMALMPGHIDKATFGLADHDSFALLFLTLAFYYWVKAVEGTNSERMFRNPSANPLYLVAGIRQMWHSNPVVMANATLAGISFSTVALGWKGFVYGPGILFLAFAAQIIMNLFRRRDSLQLTSAAIQMMMTTLIMPLPFYIWPGMNLLLAPSGFQPMFYIVGFTIALGWVTCSFRDKPWLLVLGSGGILFGGILGILWVLQQADQYDGWDILFTGGFYFSKNKIFGTIGEAQAPSRGVLFASYGPIVTIIAIGYAFVLLWRGGRNDKPSQSLLGLWVIIATYMAWTAGRFIFNATPAMAVVGAIGIAALWKSADFSNFAKVWRRSGIGTPRARFASARSASRKHPMIPALLLVFLLIASQHATYGIDSGIPRGESSAGDVDQTIYDMTPDILRFEILGLSLLDDSAHNPTDTCASGCWYMGTFGSGFNGGGWNMAYEWLSEQDTDKNFTNRPAFVSWWDYGFQALESGDHPTVADNFQSGIPNSGAMLLSSGQEQTVAMFITSLIQGDKQYEEGSDFTPEFVEVINGHLNYPQLAELTSIMNFGVGDVEFVQSRALTLIDQDEDVELLHGSKLDSNGLPGQSMWYVHEDGIQSGNSTMDENEARALYNSIRDRTEESRNNNDNSEDGEITHYVIGEYYYTSDLVEDFDDVSTNLHRANARLALARAFLTSVFTLPELVDLYDDLSTSLEYEVQNYDGSLGEKITRNNEIRYFAIDDRLYPLGGMYYEDSSYHRGQTTGIFYAPTTLSGLDPDNYIESVYITQRGDAPQRGMTGQQYEDEYLNDIVAQQSGALQDSSQIIRLVDIEYRQTEEFFETMVARIYVGYGTSTLGLSGNPSTPSPTWALSGTPGSALEYTYALPGAMMNHFAIANWYNDGTDSPDNDNNSIPDVFDGGYASIGRANSNVKIVKYYSGATLEGTVTLDEVGPIPNARVLIERDAFSGDEIPDEDGNIVDRDQRTYWVPIGTTDADENGDYSFIVPAGRIRVSAFFGEPDLDEARMQFASNARAIGNQMLQDIATESSSELGERQINLVTGILGNVSGSQWLAETIVNVSGSDGHSNGESHINADITASPSFATGRLSWSGDGEFDGEAITNAIVELSPSWDEISMDPISLETSTGTVSGSNLIFQGIGEVTFTGDGEFTSTGIASVSDFVGTHTQTIQHGHSLTGDGEFSGRGTFSGTISFDTSEDVQMIDCNQNGTMPEDSNICVLDEDQYLIDGVVNATGKFTSNGTSSFSQIHNGSTISGSGYFSIDSSDESLDSYGTINGTGTFTGEGTFSGPMVREGTFHINDAVPGLYDVTIIFEEGTRVDIDDQFIIGHSGISQIQEIDVAGGIITGDLVDSDGEPISSSVIMLGVDSDSESNGECSEVMYAPCHITAEQNGSLNFGPITPGEYTFVLDQDGDDFSEAEISHTFTSEEGTTVIFPSPIETFYDLTFTLDRIVNSSNVAVTDIDVLFTNVDGTHGQVTSVYDADLLQYNVELAEGNWILSHTLSETEQLWEEIGMFENQLESYTFRTSTSVTGVAYYETGSPDVIDGVESTDNAQTIPNVPVNFFWDGFSTTAITDENGVFNVVLPIGEVVDAIVNAGVFNVVNGTRFTVNENMDNVTMIARPGNLVDGSININRLGNFYSSSIDGWEAVTVFASHESIDAVWVVDVDQNGQFSVVLPDGNWTFETDTEWLNMSSSTLYVDGDNDTMNIYAYPMDSPVEIEFFLDNSGDNNFDNGTPVVYDFSIVSLTSFGETINVSADSDYWIETGFVSLPVEAGSYKINVEISDARSGDLFGTRIMTGESYFDVGYSGDGVSRSIGFDPEWRVDLTFVNYSNGPLAGENVKFINTDNGWILSRLTDSNGTLIDHLPEGEWIASISAVDTGDGIIEGIREIITVSADNAEVAMTLQTIELASFNVNLQGPDDQPLEGVDVILTSNDGLGKIHLDLTDASGTTEGMVYPGSWNIEVNHTDDRRRYLIDSTELSNGPLSSGPAGDFTLLTENLAELSGNVFWDLNDDDDSDVGEGVSDVTVHMTSEGQGEYHLVTDGAGDWSVYVPIGTYWNVTASTSGFSEENRTVSVDSPNSVDIELTAGSVGVSGNVSHDDIVSIGDEVELTLIPIQGMIRDRVTPTKILVDGTWNGAWNASVEPGRWIIRAEHQDSNLIAMSVIDADISEGGNSDLELEFGGWLYLSSMWLNYDGEVGNLAEDNLMDLEFIIQLGAGIEWDGILDEEGGISILLPSGTVEISSSFSVDQMNRVMDYNAGNNINIPSSATNLLASTNQEISFTRAANHKIESNISSMIGGNSSSIDLSDVQILFAEDGNYTTVEYTITVDYLGHEPISAYNVVANVAGTDGSEWNVTFLDDKGTSDNSSDDEWLEEYSFDMGLDGDNTSFDLHVRVDAANRSTAQSLAEGHTVSIQFISTSGLSNTQELVLRVPQFHGFELIEMPDVFGIRSGEEISIPMEFRNSGNGDERFEFEFDDSQLPDGWERTGATSNTLGAFVTTTHTIKVIAPQDVAGDEDFTITVYVTDKSGGTYPAIPIQVKISSPILEVKEVFSNSEPIYGTIHKFIVTVENTGLVDSNNVDLNASLRGKDVFGVTTMDVPAGEEVNFFIDVDLSSLGAEQVWVDFTIEGDDVGANPDIESKRYTLRSPGVDDSDATNYLMWALIAMLIFAIYYFTRGGIRRPGAPF